MNIQRLLDEMKSEAKITRRVLERIPADKLAWTPHQKSTPMGKLAWHVAMIPARISTVLTEQKSVDLTSLPAPRPAPATTAEILAGFDESMAAALETLAKIPASEWSDELVVRRGDIVAFQAPKKEIARSVLVKHSVHHRGQLSVYLRLLDVPVPSIYGPSADEAPVV